MELAAEEVFWIVIMFGMAFVAGYYTGKAEKEGTK